MAETAYRVRSPANAERLLKGVAQVPRARHPSGRSSSNEVAFTDDGGVDYCSWPDDRMMLARINRLIGEALREPGVGIGKPEPLGQNLSG